MTVVMDFESTEYSPRSSSLGDGSGCLDDLEKRRLISGGVMGGGGSYKYSWMDPKHIYARQMS